jgi:hypothetical protein
MILFKILHLVSVIFFVGSIFFITYVIDVVKHSSDKSEYKLFAPKVSNRARNLMFVNVAIVLASGLYMLFAFYDFRYLSLFMILKLLLAVSIIVIFYTSDWIVDKTNHIKWFHHFFHHAVIAMMMLVVIFSQIM